MIGDRLPRELTESGRYTVVEVSPVRDRIERAGLPHGCNGCEADAAKDLGADLAL